MSDKYHNARYFHTDSLYLAAFLYTHGLWLSGAGRDPDGQYRFIFRDTVETSSFVWRFRSAPKAMVDARTFAFAVEELKDRAERVRRISTA